MESKQPILVVKDLKQHFKINRNFTVKAVDGISFEIMPGETYGLVGESGSGKSTTGRSIIRLYKPTDGSIIFNGEDISGKMSKNALKDLRTNMQMIFQDPIDSLDPRLTVKEIIAEGMYINGIKNPEYINKKVNEAYGTLEELKALVKKAHEKDMRVILDWVANHTSWDNAWIQNKSWYTQDAGGNIVSPEGMGWTDVADLDYSNTEMREAMLDAMKYWITEADVDGFRCDHAEGVPDDFWAQAINELKALKGAGLLMLAEGSKSSLYTAGFDIVYGWEFASKLGDVFSGKATLSALYDVHKKEYQEVPEGKQRLRYSTNHDLASEHSPLQTYGNDRGAMAAFVIASTLGGTPLIYSSQEIAYSKALSFFDYQLMDWNLNSDYLNEYKKLMEIYTSSSMLRSAGVKIYDTGKAASFYRVSGDEAILVIANTSSTTETIKVPIERVGDRMRNLMDNEVVTLPVVLTMEPYQYYIWKKE